MINNKLSKYNLKSIVTEIPSAWKSVILGEVGPAQIKVLRMDEMSYGEESHDYNEALIVISGNMELVIEDVPLTVNASEIVIIPANTPHSVLPGSSGILMIVDICLN